MYNHQTAIAILGSRTEPKEATKTLASGLVAELAKAGYVTLTSDEHGCLNAMHEASQRAQGVMVITSANHETKLTGANVLQSPTILGRMEATLRTADAIVITDGGIQSLAVLFQVWSYGSSPNLPFRPLILLGNTWNQGINALIEAGWLSKTEQAMVTTVETVQEAVESLRYYAGSNNGV